MTPENTGKFISSLRKEKELTQGQLAEKLSVTNKAISRWETGKGYPDVTSLMALGSFFGVSVNELLNGERIKTENLPEITEKNMTAMLKLNEKKTIVSKRRIYALAGISAGLSAIIIIALCFIIKAKYDDVYYKSMGSSNCIIAEDYSEINFCGQTYVPIIPEKNAYRIGQVLVTEASVENAAFTTKLLFGDSIYAVEGCFGNELIYLQTDYDYNESDLYCLKDKLSYYQEVFKNDKTEKYYFGLSGDFEENCLIRIDDNLVNDIILHPEKLKPADKNYILDAVNEPIYDEGIKGMLQFIIDILPIYRISDFITEPIEQTNLSVCGYGSDGVTAFYVGAIGYHEGKYYWQDTPDMPYEDIYNWDNYEDVGLYEIPKEYYPILEKCLKTK